MKQRNNLKMFSWIVTHAGVLDFLIAFFVAALALNTGNSFTSAAGHGGESTLYPTTVFQPTDDKTGSASELSGGSRSEAPSDRPADSAVTQNSVSSFSPPLPTPVSWSANQSSLTRSGLDEIISSIDHFKSSCPDNIQLLKQTCLKNRFTCRNRCGATIASKNSDLMSFSCYCDKLCTIYKDCCPDFRGECPDEFAESLDREENSQLMVARTECLREGYKVVTSCGDKETNITHLKNGLSSSNLLVTDLLTGITYLNYSIFYCHAEQDSIPASWNKTIKSNTAFDASFLAEGYGYSVAGFIVDYPPPGIYPRGCSTVNNINCFGLVTATCYFLSPSSTTDFCAQIYELADNITLGNGSVISGHDTASSGVFCRVKQKSRKQVESFAFAVTMSLSEDNGMFLISSSADASASPWEQIACRVDDETGEMICDKMKCNEGYFFTGNSCMRPKFLEVTFIFRGLSSAVFSKILSILSNVMTSLNPQLVCEPDGGFVDMEKGEPVYTDSYRIVNNSLLDEGGETAPASELKLLLLDIPQTELLEFPEYIQVCFIFQLTVYGVVTGDQFQGTNEDVALRCDIIKISVDGVRSISVTTTNPSFLAGLPEEDESSSFCDEVNCEKGTAGGLGENGTRHKDSLLWLMLFVACRVALASSIMD